jgi:hypothetical protein
MWFIAENGIFLFALLLIFEAKRLLNHFIIKFDTQSDAL